MRRRRIELGFFHYFIGCHVIRFRYFKVYFNYYFRKLAFMHVSTCQIWQIYIYQLATLKFFIFISILLLIPLKFCVMLLFYKMLFIYSHMKQIFKIFNVINMTYLFKYISSRILFQVFRFKRYTDILVDLKTKLKTIEQPEFKFKKL